MSSLAAWMSEDMQYVLGSCLCFIVEVCRRSAWVYAAV